MQGFVIVYGSALTSKTPRDIDVMYSGGFSRDDAERYAKAWAAARLGRHDLLVDAHRQHLSDCHLLCYPGQQKKHRVIAGRVNQVHWVEETSLTSVLRAAGGSDESLVRATAVVKSWRKKDDKHGRWMGPDIGVDNRAWAQDHTLGYMPCSPESLVRGLRHCPDWFLGYFGGALGGILAKVKALGIRWPEVVARSPVSGIIAAGCTGQTGRVHFRPDDEHEWITVVPYGHSLVNQCPVKDLYKWFPALAQVDAYPPPGSGVVITTASGTVIRERFSSPWKSLAICLGAWAAERKSNTNLLRRQLDDMMDQPSNQALPEGWTWNFDDPRSRYPSISPLSAAFKPRDIRDLRSIGWLRDA